MGLWVFAGPLRTICTRTSPTTVERSPKAPHHTLAPKDAPRLPHASDCSRPVRYNPKLLQMKTSDSKGTSTPQPDAALRPSVGGNERGAHAMPRGLVVALAIAIPVAYAFIINAGSLDSPPAWDSATTVSPAALTIVDRGFDIWEVAGLPSSLEGGPSIHATSLYTIALAGLIWLVGSSTAFYVTHVVSILLVGALCAATYLLARLRASAPVSALCAVTVGIIPLVVQQGSDVYLDLPLAVVVTLAAWAAIRRDFRLTSVLVILGVAIKTSGVFLIPLLFWAKPESRSSRRHLRFATGATALALLPFAAAFVNTTRFDNSDGLLSGALTLVGSSAAMLFETLDLFIILSIYLLVTYSRARSHTLDRPSLVTATMVASFFVVYGGTMILSRTIAILPRYYIAILPALLASLLPREQPDGRTAPKARMVGIGLVSALAMFSLINVRGDFYPLPNNEFYVLAERSTRAQELLELQVAGTQELVATDLPLIVDGPTHFRLAYPDLGYVDDPSNSVITTYEAPPDLPDEFAMLIERRFGNVLVGIEERAKAEGYTLEYRDITLGGFGSELIVASR